MGATGAGAGGGAAATAGGAAGAGAAGGWGTDGRGASATGAGGGAGTVGGTGAATAGVAVAAGADTATGTGAGASTGAADAAVAGADAGGAAGTGVATGDGVATGNGDGNGDGDGDGGDGGDAGRAEAAAAAVAPARADASERAISSTTSTSADSSITARVTRAATSALRTSMSFTVRTLRVPTFPRSADATYETPRDPAISARHALSLQPMSCFWRSKPTSRAMSDWPVTAKRPVASKAESSISSMVPTTFGSNPAPPVMPSMATVCFGEAGVAKASAEVAQTRSSAHRRSMRATLPRRSASGVGTAPGRCSESLSCPAEGPKVERRKPAFRRMPRRGLAPRGRNPLNSLGNPARHAVRNGSTEPPSGGREKR